jgi:hypothetical protein
MWSSQVPVQAMAFGAVVYVQTKWIVSVIG